MPEQLWLAPLKRRNVASAASQNSFTQLTQISPTPDAVIPANFLVPGQSVKVRASGRFGSNGTPTLTLGLYYGGVAGTALVTTAALTTFTSANSSTFVSEFEFTCRTEGSAGTAWTTGQALGITSTTAVALAPSAGGAAITIDTTAAKALVLGASFSVQHGLNAITVDQWDVIV